MKTLRLMLAPVAVVAAALPVAANAKIYAVIMEIKAQDGVITDIVLASVIDVASGSTTPVKGVKVSDAYIRTVREEIMAKDGGKGTGGFIYRYMDTRRPDYVKMSPF